MSWFRHGKATAANAGVRELQRQLGEATMALNSAEAQLSACIERVKEARRTLEHDELVLAELSETLVEALRAQIIRMGEYNGLRRSLREIRKTMKQRRLDVEAARTAVETAAGVRDGWLQKTMALKATIERYRTVIPWTRK